METLRVATPITLQTRPVCNVDKLTFTSNVPYDLYQASRLNV